MPLPGEVFDFINRKSLNNTKITSDIDMRVGNNIISNYPSREDTHEICDPENDDEIVGSKLENFGRVFPPDQESSSVEYEENDDDNSPITLEDNVIQDKGIGGAKHSEHSEPEASNDDDNDDNNFRNEK